MTLEEAKREIKELSDIQMELFDKTYDRKIYGEARAYEEAGHILDEVDTEPVGNPDKMTLKELAHEMRKIFKFDYLTCEGCGDLRDYIIWLDKPEYIGDGWTRYSISDVLLLFESCRLAIQIDLSEYADENGNIDYSKCIVEVE